MKIAVVNEISASARNIDILNALDGKGFEILNLGNTNPDNSQPLQYIHTGLISALLLHLGVVDFVVGGCGTGVGYLNSVLQYPGVVCGHLLTPLDAYLFSRINAGNCVSLALNQGYGWAGEVNLRMIFDELFNKDQGTGFPTHRAEPQRKSRELLAEVTNATHRPFPEILKLLPKTVIEPVFGFLPFKQVISSVLVKDSELNSAIQTILK